MMQGTYYKEWSRMLGREMEFKVYGTAGVPVLALPARGGRFYDWENNGMPEAVASLLSSGKLQLFTADGIDAESLLAGDAAPRRRAEMQEKYFNYLSTELAARIRELNQTEKGQRIWCVGVDTGACQAVNCRLRRPQRRLLPRHRRPRQLTARQRHHHRPAGHYHHGPQQDGGNGRGRREGKVRCLSPPAHRRQEPHG